MKFSKFLIVFLLPICTFASAQEVRALELVPAYAKIPVSIGGVFNSTVDMTAEVFTPAGQGPFSVVLYSHGRSSTPQERADIKEVIPRDYLRFWLARGFAVVAPVRPGYGKTGGPDREMPGHAWDTNGSCTRLPNFRRVMEVASPTVLATIDWLRKQAWANTSSLVLTGNSVGGILTVAVGSQNVDGVVGFINFAGGIGGNPSVSPGKSCDPNQLQDLYASYGKKAKVQSLWMYAENDQFWGADAPKSWHRAFSEGGSSSQLVTSSALVGQDGHDLVFFGKDLWVKPVEAFLRQLGF